MGRKKRAVQDKYYHLAKEQGYRARSSFKLVQLNKKYDLLSKTKRVIDLCAAPGGWLQVCVKSMPKTPDRQIIGVDLLPIKPIPGCVTFQNDITTDECRRVIRKELKGEKAELVLCDGAPNVGAEYSKDAFVQNELTVHALRFACDHLVRGGNFVTKVFRSADYNSLMWSFQQLFKKVEATKPASSRNVSAEIFVVCRGFLAPHKIDPRLLDPKYVLDTVEADRNISEASAVGLLFHKKNKEKRNRGGYDPSMGQALFRSESAATFIKTNEPIKTLASVNEIHFKDEDAKWLLTHPATTQEVKACLEDLKVLGNAEMRLLLRWRSSIRSYLKKKQEEEEENEGKGDKPADEDDASESGDDDDSESGSSDSDDSDGDSVDEIDDELARVKAEKAKKKKKLIKKKRREHVKMQRRIDLGMENEFAIDLAEENGPFSAKELGLKSTKKLGDIQANIAVDFDSDDASSADEKEQDGDQSDSEDDYLERLEEEADQFYENKKSKELSMDPMSVQERRRQRAEEKKAKLKKSHLENLASQDFAKALEEEQKKAVDAGAYEKLLQEDDSEDDSDEDGTAAQEKASAKADQKRAERWFRQSIFEGANADSDEDESDANMDNSSEEEDDSSEDESIGEMPLPSAKTEKMKRHERRLKLQRRNERKEEKRRLATLKEAQEFNPDIAVAGAKNGFETVPGESEEMTRKRRREWENELEEEMEMEEPKTERPAWAKDLIRKGMGNTRSKNDEKDGFEVVKAEPQRVPGDDSSDSEDDEEEEEKYNSEDYDTDERAQHLALGALLTKKSKRRKVLDAAYNRYAFNDDELPSWFVEDENKHYRPQLPITKDMVDAVKARYKDLASRSINKVAEAKARKKRRLMTKVEKAKKQAAAVVEQEDISTGSKMRAIEKIYKKVKADKPKTVMVVARKSQKGKVNVSGKQFKGKKVKVVDRRMKSDERNAKLRAKSGRKGKGGKGKGRKRR